MADSNTIIMRCDSSVVVPCSKQSTATEDDPAQLEEILAMLTPRPLEDVPKQTRWVVMTAKAPAGITGDEIYDRLWAKIGNDRRHLSVTHQDDCVVLIFHKEDQAIVKQGAFSGDMELQKMYKICQSRGAGAMRREIVEFCKVWFTQRELISNFALIQEPPLPMEDVYKANAPLSDRKYLMNIAEAKQKSPNERNADETRLLKVKSEVSALRALDKKDVKMAAEKESNDCYEAVTGEGLHMPTHFAGVDQWMGETWDPETKQKWSMSFLHYLNSPEHLERTAVLYSDAGSGKTPASKATARAFAMRYQNSPKPYYLVAGSPNGFKTAYKKGLVQKGVPRVIEDFKPMGNPNGKRQTLEENLVQLLNVKDGGTIDTPGGTTIKFPPETPQLISTNLTFEEWIDAFSKFPIKIQNAILKRIVFFTVPDSPLVKQELRKRKKEDMLSTVEEGLLREQEFLKRHCPDTGHLTISSTSAGSVPTVSSVSELKRREGEVQEWRRMLDDWKDANKKKEKELEERERKVKDLMGKMVAKEMEDWKKEECRLREAVVQEMLAEETRLADKEVALEEREEKLNAATKLQCSSKETPMEVKRTPASPAPAEEDSDDSYSYYSDTSSEEN